MIYEDYRPREFGEVIGQERAVKVLSRLVERAREGKYSHGAIWIEGNTGTGKTTLAYITAYGLGATEHSITEIDARGLTLEAARRMVEASHYKNLYGTRVYIINEGQTMSKAAGQYLLTALESIPDGTYWIFTSTTEVAQLDLFGKDAQQNRALASRVLTVSLTNQGLAKAFAARAREIAAAEGLDGAPLSVYEKRCRELRNNMRALLQEVEEGRFIA